MDTVVITPRLDALNKRLADAEARLSEVRSGSAVEALEKENSYVQSFGTRAMSTDGLWDAIHLLQEAYEHYPQSLVFQSGYFGLVTDVKRMLVSISSYQGNELRMRISKEKACESSVLADITRTKDEIASYLASTDYRIDSLEAQLAAKASVDVVEAPKPKRGRPAKNSL